MTSQEKATILRYVYLTLKQKLTKIKTYEYEHHILLLILISFNLFKKLFLTKIHVLQIESISQVIVLATSYFSCVGMEPL